MDEGPERRHVLAELADHHVGAVAAPPAGRSGAGDTLCVGVAEDELAHRQGLPVEPPRRSHGGCPRRVDADDPGLGDAVEEPEVLPAVIEPLGPLQVGQVQSGVPLDDGQQVRGAIVEPVGPPGGEHDQDVRGVVPEPGVPVLRVRRSFVAHERGPAGPPLGGRPGGNDRICSRGMPRRSRPAAVSATLVVTCGGTTHSVAGVTVGDRWDRRRRPAAASSTCTRR